MQNETLRQGGTETSARGTREPDAQDGIFGTWITLSVGMVESTIRTSTRVGRSLLGETKGAVNATIGFVDQAGQAVFRGARALNDGAFGLADEALARIERGALVVLSHSQSAGDRASELAAATSQAIAGSRGLTPAPAH